MADTMTIAVLGGTGDMGSALVRFLARQGHRVILASRDPEKARRAVAEVADGIADARIEGAGLAEAAAAADLVVLAVPYAAQQATLEAVRDGVQGKILVDATVPLRPPKVARVQLPAAGCAAMESQNTLGPNVRVVSALQNVAAHVLANGEKPHCDVLVTGDDEAARQVVIDLLTAGGLTAWHAGPLANAAAAEAMTSVLIGINKRYRVQGAGLRITTDA
jgi:8-hydroxy-5-deazaflavin:NADPH oxidoreductase